MTMSDVNEYVQLEGNTVDKAFWHGRRIWAVCLGVLSGGLVVILCARMTPSKDQSELDNLANVMHGSMGAGTRLAAQKPIIPMAGQYLQPARAQQWKQHVYPGSQPAGVWQSLRPAMAGERDVHAQAKKNDVEYSVADALKMVKEGAKANFDETIEVAMNLGIDPRKSDQNVRGVTQLPAGTGKTVTVAVFTEAEKAKEAKEAGADIVGTDEIADKVSKGNIEFDKLIATPDMMPRLAKLARILGPKGLMPNPKLGTVTTDVAEAVKASKGGQVGYRNDKTANVHAGIGKASFSEKDLEENFRAFVEAVGKAKPASVKGAYVKKISLSSTMGKGVKLDLADVGVR